jgi:hypothetical protein
MKENDLAKGTMTTHRHRIIEKIFAAQNEDGLWKRIDQGHKHYPSHLHYVPTYRGSLWALLLLAELKCDPNDPRVTKPLAVVQNHLFDEDHGIYALKEDHFPIPCLNGNMLYLQGYFNGKMDKKHQQLIDFFLKNQRFDDGSYVLPINAFCSNKSCYGKHSCYWGVVKLLKGISFIPKDQRNEAVGSLRQRCIDFILLHKVCYSSHRPEKIMVDKIDLLTFPNFYKGDFLEILWILRREEVISEHLTPALELLQSKQLSDGQWPLERKMNNMVTSIGPVSKGNAFVTERAREVLQFYARQLVST